MNRKLDPGHRQRGAAAVEFALVLPVFLLLVMGAIDWGWYFFIDQVITNSAREGARAGTVLAPPPTSTAAQAIAAAKTASESFLARANFEKKGVVATYTTVDGTDAIQVTVTYPAGSLTGLSSARPEGTFSDPKDLVGRVLLSKVVKNEAVLNTKLASREAGSGMASLLPENMRAAAVRVDDVVGVAGDLPVPAAGHRRGRKDPGRVRGHRRPPPRAGEDRALRDRSDGDRPRVRGGVTGR